MRTLKIYHQGGEILSGASYTLRSCKGALDKAGPEGYAISLRHGSREVWLAVRSGRCYGPQILPVEIIETTAETHKPRNNRTLGHARDIRKKVS